MKELKETQDKSLLDFRSKSAEIFASDTPSIYFNSFINLAGNTDVVIVLQRNSQPVAILNASFTTVKSLAEKLTVLVTDFEKVTSHKIMTGDEIAVKTIEKKKSKDADVPS